MSTPSIGFVSSPLAGPGSVRPNGVAPPPPPRTTEAAPEPTDTLTSAAPSDLGLIQPGIAQAAAAVEGVPVSALREITEQAMTSRGLTTTFSPEALDQLARIPGPAPIDEPGVVDMRHLPWVSIDNESTRDIDQLAAAQDLGNGRTRLLVAIADVAAVVGKDSPLDRQAQQNTSTVYTPGTTMSMLPEQLSTDWTSLGPGVDRRAMVTELIVDKNGDVESSKVFQAAVNNHCKTDYNAVSGWLDGSRPEPRNIADQPAMDDQLRLQMDVGKRLGEAAHRRGALEFTTDRVTPVQKDGRIVGIEPEKKNLANEAVANMMIATNMANAKFLHDRGLPVLQRVVRPPERWDRMREVAAQEASHLPGGHEMPSEVAVLPSQPDPKALGHYMDEMHRLDPDRSN
jgi:exoribonuclease-2